MSNLLRRLLFLVRYRKRAADLEEEMAFHRALTGGPAFGNATLAREDARAVWTGGSVERLLQDVRYGVRALRKQPGFALVAILTLALGIGATTAMFTVVNGVILRPLPFADADRLAMVWTADPRRGIREATTSYPTYQDWRRDTRAFEDLGFWRLRGGNLAGPEPERVLGAFASANLLPLLGVRPAIGRTFTADEEQRREFVVVVSHGLWQRRFGGAPDVIGRSLDIDGRTMQIVGVMPEGFYFPIKDVQHWEPATIQGAFQAKPLLHDRSWTNRQANLWNVVGRLKPGLSAADAQDDLAAIGRRLAAQYPIADPDFPGFDVEVVPMLVQVTGRNLQLALWTLMGAVGFVLLIACANVANLLLARGVTRQREFAVRAAIGANRGRLLRQLAIENTLLAAAAGIAGGAIAAAGIRVLGAAATIGIPRLDEVTLDGRALIFTAAVSLLASVLCGTAPAWRLSSGSAADSLKQSGALTGGVSARRLRRLLVVVECALAVMLLAGAGLLIRSLSSLRAVNPGFDSSRVLLVRINLPLPVSKQWRTQEWATFQQMEDRIAQIPGVIHAGMIQNYLNPSAEEAITIEGAAAASGDALVSVTDTTPNLFRAMGVPLVAGRFFTQQEVNGTTALVNQAFAKRFFGNEDPVGRRFKEGNPTSSTPWYTIVGVVGDMHRQGLERDPSPEYYYCSSEPTMDIAVRASGDPAAHAPAVREAIRSVYANAVIIKTATVEATLGDLSAQRRFQTWLMTLFAGVGLVLAAIGTYGTVHFAVAQQAQDIGIRMALGAGRGDIARLIVARGMALPIAGTALGLAGALALTRVMRHLLFRVEPGDPLTFGAVAALLLTVAAVACWFPARRAMRLDPLVALRHE